MIKKNSRQEPIQAAKWHVMAEYAKTHVAEVGINVI